MEEGQPPNPDVQKEIKLECTRSAGRHGGVGVGQVGLVDTLDKMEWKANSFTPHVLGTQESWLVISHLQIPFLFPFP